MSLPSLQPDTSQPGFEKRAGNAVAFMVSLTFHVGLLLVLACWVFTAGRRSEGLLVNASLGKSDATSLDSLQSFELSPAAQEVDLETFDADPDFAMDLQIESTMETQGAGDRTTLTSLAVDSVIRDLKKQGEGRGASFFGAYAEGNRFVYVLDSSRSMTGDRWTYACNQLLDSLNGLRPGQEFFLVCFDLKTSFVFNTLPGQIEFLEADDSTVKRVKNWLRGRELGQATMPRQALEVALQLQPDAIFLLSDGELQDNSRFVLRRINSNVSELRQIPIHTVHLFSAQGRETLRMIAQENGGTFTPIEEGRRLSRFRRR